MNFSAVTSGIKEIREVMAQAEGRRRMGGKTVLFVDEIHRFNKAQQDAFLPFVEKGSIILIGQPRKILPLRSTALFCHGAVYLSFTAFQMKNWCS